MNQTNPVVDHQLEIKRVVDEINVILGKHRIEQRLNYSDLNFQDKIATDAFKADSLLSQAIIDHIWPSVSSIEVCHFTSRAAATSILSTRTFRLTSILKRFKDGEIAEFCKDHELDGYLDSDERDEPTYKSLVMPNMFYASFTEKYLTPDEARRMYDRFGGEDGVCITFRVRASNPNFRRIVYQSAPLASIPVLDDVMRCIKSYGDRRFVMSGVSRLAAFYLGRRYSGEMEFRMLHRVWDPDLASLPSDAGGDRYIEIPLGIGGAYGFELDVVQVQSRRSLAVHYDYPVIVRDLGN